MEEVIVHLQSNWPMVFFIGACVCYLQHSVATERTRLGDYYDRQKRLITKTKNVLGQDPPKRNPLPTGVKLVSFFQAECCDCEDQLYLDEEVKEADVSAYIKEEGWEEMGGKLYCEICIDTAYQKKKDLLLIMISEQRHNGNNYET